MKKQREFKTATDLCIKDEVYQVEGKPMLEHLKVSTKSVSLNNIKYFSLNHERIKELALSENEDEVIVNGSLKISVSGKIGEPTSKDILTDEKLATVLVIREVERQKKKTLDILKMGEDILEGLENNSKIYRDKAKDLNISIKAQDLETGDLTDLTDDNEIELDDSDD